MWKGSTHYVNDLHDLLKPLKSVHRFCYVTILNDGLKFQVLDPSHALSSQVFIDASLFAGFTFEFSEPQLLKLSLSSLVGCLHMFMNGVANAEDAATCFMSYMEGADKFELHYAFGTMTSTCRLNLLDLEGFNGGNIPFNNDRVLVQAILRATVFKSIMKDLKAASDKPELEKVMIAAYRQSARLEFSSASVLASSDLVIPQQEIMDAFRIEEDTSFEYQFAMLDKVREAASRAKRVSLRYDDCGVLSLQFEHITMDNKLIFYDTRILSLDTDGEGPAGFVVR